MEREKVEYFIEFFYEFGFLCLPQKIAMEFMDELNTRGVVHQFDFIGDGFFRISKV